MKVLATSDLHGNLEGIDPVGCDLVIIAGDIAPLRSFSSWDIYNQKKWFQKDFASWMSSYPEVEFVFIPGNHDLSLDPNCTSKIHNFNFKMTFPENAHLLCDSSIEIFGHKIYGTPWVPVISWRWAFEADHSILSKEFSKIPEKLDILIAHAPPHIINCNADFSLQTNAGPFGSNELALEILKKQPKYCFCGHIHSGSHAPFKHFDTTVVNVSRLDEHYHIAYAPTVVEIT